MLKYLAIPVLLTILACSSSSPSNNGGSSNTPTPTDPTTPTSTTFPGKFRYLNPTQMTVRGEMQSVASYRQDGTPFFNLALEPAVDPSIPYGNFHRPSATLLPDGRLFVDSDRFYIFSPEDEKFYPLKAGLERPFSEMNDCGPRNAVYMPNNKVYCFNGFGGPSKDKIQLRVFDLCEDKEVSSLHSYPVWQLNPEFQLPRYVLNTFKISDTEIYLVLEESLGCIYNIEKETLTTDIGISGTGIDERSIAQAKNGDIYSLYSDGSVYRYDIKTRTETLFCDFKLRNFGIVSSVSIAILEDGRVMAVGGKKKVSEFESQLNYDKAFISSVDGKSYEQITLPGGVSRAECIQLSNGRVLVTGGGGQMYHDSEDIQLVIDVNTKVAGYTGKMIETRKNHRMHTLPNGKVLVYGGGGKSEIFDPEANVYILTNGTTSIPAGQIHKFTAEYKGTVTWDCSLGLIDQNGYWTAPWEYETSEVKIQATSTTDPTKFSYCFVSIVDPKDVIAILGKMEVKVNEENPLTARVFYLQNKMILWTVTSPEGSATITPEGIFKATIPGEYKVQAASPDDARYTKEVTIKVTE